MKRVKSIIHSSGGFTLVEIIITIIAAGILGYVFASLMGTAMENSWKSIEIVAGEANAEGTMNAIITRYVKEVNNDPNNALATMKSIAASFGDNVSMDYITFDPSGDEQPSGIATNTLKVTVQAPGKDFITIITRSRKDADPIVKY